MFQKEEQKCTQTGTMREVVLCASTRHIAYTMGIATDMDQDVGVELGIGQIIKDFKCEATTVTSFLGSLRIY